MIGSCGIKVIGFDADDTLWHCEPYFRKAEAEFAALFCRHSSEEVVGRLHAIMIASLPEWGYGVKSVILAMFRCALEFSDGNLPGALTAEIIAIGDRLKAREATPYEDAAPTLAKLRDDGYILWLITKGDLLDQELKITASGLAGYFDHIEIVSEKNIDSYARLLRRYQVRPADFLMVGNSLRSDLLPVLNLGGHGIFCPSSHTWHHENADVEQMPPFTTISSLSEIPLILPACC